MLSHVAYMQLPLSQKNIYTSLFTYVVVLPQTSTHIAFTKSPEGQYFHTNLAFKKKNAKP